MNEQLNILQEKFNAVTQNFEICFLEYEIKSKKILNANNTEIFFSCADSKADSLNVHLLDKTMLNTMIKSIAEGKGDTKGELRLLKNGNTKYDWYEVSFSALSSTNNEICLMQIIPLEYTEKLTGALKEDKFNQFILQNLQKTNYVYITLEVFNFIVFKEIFGTEITDSLLKSIVQTIEKSLQEKEMVANCGNGYFSLYFNHDDAETTQKRLYKIIDEIQANFRINYDESYDLLLYAGAVVTEESDKTMQTIKDKCNIALKTAKTSSVSKFVLFDDSMVQHLEKEKILTAELENALKSKDFAMYLQPIFNVETGRVVGAEALARWNNKEGAEQITPRDFFPIIESRQWGMLLDKIIFENACNQIVEWEKQGYKPVGISVNFCELNIKNITFVEELKEITDKYGVNPKYLEIEFRESVVFKNKAVLCTILEKLHKYGFSLAIDNFGTGYSTLALLRNMPVDIIKIDSSLLNDSTDIGRTELILKSIVDMSKGLNILTVAQSVERVEDAILLENIKCDCVQGNFYTKPIPPVMFDEFLYTCDDDE